MLNAGKASGASMVPNGREASTVSGASVIANASMRRGGGMVANRGMVSSPDMGPN